MYAMYLGTLWTVMFKLTVLYYVKICLGEGG
jgi:hypothetical protein